MPSRSVSTPAFECNRNSSSRTERSGQSGSFAQRENCHVRVNNVRGELTNGVRVLFRSFWSDPIWKGLRIVSFVSASVTLILLAVFLSGDRSWLVLLYIALVTNVAIMVALVIRTIVLHAKLGRTPKS